MWLIEQGADPMEQPLGVPGDLILNNCQLDDDLRTDSAVLHAGRTLHFRSSTSGQLRTLHLRNMRRNQLQKIACLDVTGDGIDELLLLAKPARGGPPAFRVISVNRGVLLQAKAPRAQGILALDVDGDGQDDPGYYSRMRGHRARSTCSWASAKSPVPRTAAY